MVQTRFSAEALSLPGAVRITPSIHRDNRGDSVATYSVQEFAELGIDSRFVESYTSHSKKGVVRGLHFQRSPHAQDKLVRCSRGEVFAVVADCNPSSPTYKQYASVTLAGAEHSMLFVPGTYAFGFCVTGEEALVEYLLSDAHHPESAGGVRYDDPALAIPWPTTEPILSAKDMQWPPLV